MIRVVLPSHLRTLVGVTGEAQLDTKGSVMARSVLHALEASYPILWGSICDQVTQQRQPLVSFFACGQDLSHEPTDTRLPEPIATGAQPFLIVGAIAGGWG